VAAHGGRTCQRGHSLSVAGTDASGRCRACTAARARRYYAQQAEAERERSRRYHQAHREAIVARKRAKRSRVKPPGKVHPWRIS